MPGKSLCLASPFPLSPPTPHPTPHTHSVRNAIRHKIANLCRLGQLWMFEAPLIFWAIWKAVSPFIDPVTRKKVQFVSEKHGPAEMANDIPHEVPRPSFRSFLPPVLYVTGSVDRCLVGEDNILYLVLG